MIFIFFQWNIMTYSEIYKILYFEKINFDYKNYYVHKNNLIIVSGIAM
jgi:hypothetical protein